MLTKCANPRCSAEFYSLRHGRLFVLDAQPPRGNQHASGCVSAQPERLEYFWLCDSCCKSMRITIDSDHRILVTSFEDPEAKPLPALPRAHPPSERHPPQGAARRLRQPSDAWRDSVGVKKMF